MSYDWLPKLEFETLSSPYYASRRSRQNTMYKINPIIDELTHKFPKGDSWLFSSEKQEIRNETYTEIVYIIPWAWQRQICNPNINPKYFEARNSFISYLFNNRRPGSDAITKWAIRFNLLSQEEIQIIKENHKDKRDAGSFKNDLAIYALSIMKPLKNFTEEDIQFCLENCTKYSRKNVIKFFASCKYISKDSRLYATTRDTWNTLFEDDIYGAIFRSFYDHLVACDVDYEYLRVMKIVLKDLLSFCHFNGFSSFRSFSYETFLELTSYLRSGPRSERSDRTVAHLIGRMKRLFEWGTGLDFFPLSNDFPDEWKTIIFNAMKSSRQGEGHAFPTFESAENLVKAIISYEPLSEIEFLAKCFWLVSCSATPRFSFILNLESGFAMKSMPNQPSAMGLYSQDEDKAGNKYGQFPILDSIGITAIKQLETRITNLKLKPLWNEKTRRSYIHLFQLGDSSGVPNKTYLYNFLLRIKSGNNLINSDGNIMRGAAHAFRTHLLTHIAVKTGNIDAVRVAAGHLDEKMTRVYLKSKVARNALLFRVVEKYEKKELSGLFYFRLMTLLTSDDTPVDTMMRELTNNDLTLEEYISKYGKRLDMGYCMNQDKCGNWFKCWGCHHFLMTREEIHAAIETLASQIMNLREMIRLSKNYTDNNSIAAGQMKVITLIIKRLMDLGLNQEEIDQLVTEYYGKRKSCYI